ncbi:hypothetical protein [Ruegeria hyattellae]|uniref:hypothetical protein n=1 Tax=Ruegeria hyattellae TaxID=3233337 RepID=UPI00355B6498
MDWLKALDRFFKVKDVYDKAKEIKDVHDYGQKISKKKSLSWNNLKYFKNGRMETALKNAKAAVKAADTALKVKAILPATDSSKKYAKLLAAAYKSGHDSKQAKAAKKAYEAELSSYARTLRTLLHDLQKRQKLLDGKLATARSLQKYGTALNKAFMTCAKIPNLSGTSQNAEFFALAQDAKNFAGYMGSLVSRLEKLRKANAAAAAEGKRLAAQNEEWINWAFSDRTMEPQLLKKNERAQRPRK